MTLSNSTTADRLIALPEVIDIAGIGKTMIYRLVRKGRFPQPFRPGGFSTRWSELEVRAWIDRQRAPKPA